MSDEEILRRWWKREKDKGYRGMATNGLDVSASEIIDGIRERISLVEEQMLDAAKLSEGLGQLGQAIREAQGQIQWLAQQRNVAEAQLAINTRATALDLAIKAAPGAAGDITELAEAFVTWLRAGR